VGKILSAEKHPNAERMYLEKIDVGESEPRQICSGLVGRVPMESLPNSLCVVVANLKPADLRGMMSAGMILAASSADDTKASLVIPPSGSAVGERVYLATASADEKHLAPDANGTVDIKKKDNPWTAVAPDMKTNASGQVTYKGVPLVTQAGPLVSALVDCKVK